MRGIESVRDRVSVRGVGGVSLNKIRRKTVQE